jgi:prepilin-type N-terminal cleavage/methylation domain-containing protein
MCHAGAENSHMPPQTPSRTRPAAGFTVIESIFVLMIIAIAAAFAIPQVASYMQSYRLGVASHDVATALQRARYIATSTNTRAGINIGDASNVDILQYDPQGVADPKNMGGVHLPDGISISPEAPKQIAFDGRGVITPLPQASPVIQVNGSDGSYTLVTVSPTGQVTISDVRRISNS